MVFRREEKVKVSTGIHTVVSRMKQDIARFTNKNKLPKNKNNIKGFGFNSSLYFICHVS